MAAIVHVVQTLKGKIDTDKAMAALKGWKFNSPRGPIMIDPDTRDIVMNEYLSEVVKGKDGKLHQKALGKIEHVKDACKEFKIGRLRRLTAGSREALCAAQNAPKRRARRRALRLRAARRFRPSIRPRNRSQLASAPVAHSPWEGVR